MQEKSGRQSEQQLVKRCLCHQRDAWQSFFDQYLETIERFVRQHARWDAQREEVVEETTQHVCLLLLSEPRILTAFLQQELCLRSFLAKLAYGSVRHAYTRLHKRRMLPLLWPDSLAEAVHLDWLDLARMRELSDRLSPTLRRYLRELFEEELAPEEAHLQDEARSAERTAAPDRDRQLKHRLLRALEEFDRMQ
jgi:hypothetical protein